MGVPFLLFLLFIKQGFPVGFVVIQSMFHGPDNRALAGGGATELIENTAVFFHRPSSPRRAGEGVTVKAEYPGGIVLMNLVAQSRRFPVLPYPDAGKRSIVLNTYGDFHNAVVAPCYNGVEYQARGFSPEPGAIDVGNRLRAEISRQANAYPVSRQIIIMSKRQQFVAQCKDGQVLATRDLILEKIPEGIDT